MDQNPTATAVSAVDERRAAWLQNRKSAIGGSEVAAILLPPELRPAWCSPINVWLDKTGQKADEEKPWMLAGRRMERAILELYADQTEQAIEFADSYNFIRDPKLSILGASLDARLLGGDRRPVDAKNIRFKDSAKYGAPGSDVIPLYYACQLHTQIIATVTPCADLAVLFSGQDLERFTVYRDEETIDMIREKVSAWWERHIVGGVPPDPEGTPAFADYLSKKFKGGIEKMVVPDDALMADVRLLAAARDRSSDAEMEKKRLENLLKLAIGDLNGIEGVCSWKKSKDSSETDWQAVARDLMPLLAKQDESAIKKIIAAHTAKKPGSRRFLFTFKED